VVRRIFELAARGETKAAIAKALEAEGPVRRNGKPWTRRQVSAVLARQAFYRDGLLAYGDATGENSALRLLTPSKAVIGQKKCGPEPAPESSVFSPGVGSDARLPRERSR
jgi:hypothetical protein